jgi:uncharacterized protein YfiM (DUF2279 family)
MSSVYSQTGFDAFFKPSDTLHTNRRNTVIITESVLTATALVGLNQLWYADYPKSDFHTVNDNSNWMQMDKLGHVYSSYQLGRYSAEMLNWSGVSKKNQLLYGAGYGFVFLTTVEVFDGYSAEWGFSWVDVVANAAGTSLYVSQELLWKEQRIIPKFSFHTTDFAKQNPDVLGSSLSEQILKDYNGQTYWLSANVASFFKTTPIPKWFNIALGYGADGMLSATDSPNQEQIRQFYLSLDVDLTKIKSNSHILKTVFSFLNSVKIPAPTFEINTSGNSKFHLIYF